MRAFLPGIYPRSDALVQATRDLDRGRTTAEAVDEQVSRDLAALLAVQGDAGLDLSASGMLAWQDLFRPLVEGSLGLEPGALTRFLDTNTFYRAPRASGPPRLVEPLSERYFPSLGERALATLPSPYAFAAAAGLDPRDIAAGVLAPQIEALDAELVVLAEPFLAHAANAELAALAEALALLPTRAPLALQITFGNAEPLLEALVELPVEGIGVDFYATRIDAVPAGFPKALLAGVVDARSSLVEDLDELARFAQQLGDRAADVALVPNGDLQFVSEPIARQKVGVLGAARAKVVGVTA